jgi:hypothetical protein
MAIRRKPKGSKHTFAERQLMRQVASEFSQMKNKLGATRASKDLGVSVPSFYNYLAGTDLPRMEVLRRAHKKWRIKWKHIDPSSFVETTKLDSPEQYVLPFLDAVQEKDVRVAKIEREGEDILCVSFNIRFSV